jgi:hypothetical protein
MYYNEPIIIGLLYISRVLLFCSRTLRSTAAKKNENCIFGISAMFFPQTSSAEAFTVGLVGQSGYLYRP